MIEPNEVLLACWLGIPKLVWFNRLKNSLRNCNRVRSVKPKFLVTPRSHCQKLGARKALRPKLPKGASEVGNVKTLPGCPIGGPKCC